APARRALRLTDPTRQVPAAHGPEAPSSSAGIIPAATNDRVRARANRRITVSPKTWRNQSILCGAAETDPNLNPGVHNSVAALAANPPIGIISADCRSGNRQWLCSNRVRCNIGGAAVCKASIAVVLALGIVSLVQEGTNAMVALPAGLRPALTMPAVETVALRKGVTVTRHVAVRHRGVSVRARHVAVRHRGVARTRHIAAGHRGVAVRTRHIAARHRGVAARRTH